MAKKIISVFLVIAMLFAFMVPSFAHVAKDSAIVAALEKVWFANSDTVAEVTDGNGSDFWEVTVQNNGVTYIFSVTQNGTTLVDFTLPESSGLSSLLDKINVYILKAVTEIERLFEPDLVNSEVKAYEAAKAAN